MQLELRVADSDAQAVLDLNEWLAGESAVRRFGHMKRIARPPADQMGTGLEVLTLVAGSGLSVAQLLLSVFQWRQTRRPHATVTVTRADSGGVTVRMDVAVTDPEQLEALWRRLEAEE